MPKREAVARPGEGGKSTFAAGRLPEGTLSDLDALPLPALARVRAREARAADGDGGCRRP